MTDRHLFFLRPVTALYFGRPGSFNAGEDRSGVSWPIPPISSFQGMVRTRLLQGAQIFSSGLTGKALGDQIEALVGSPDRLPPEWTLNGPFPARSHANGTWQFWFPKPCFLLPPLDIKARTPVVARPLGEEADPAHRILHDSGMGGEGHDTNPVFLLLAGAPGTAQTKPDQAWISGRNLLWALSLGRTSAPWEPEECAPHLPPFIHYESKAGLAREKNPNGSEPPLPGRAKEGMLYTRERLRFDPGSGLAGSLSARLLSPLSAQSLETGSIPAGSKGGTMAFEALEAEDKSWQHIQAGDHLADIVVPDKALAWITLISPGRWESIEELSGMLNSASDLNITVRALLCHPTIYLGGYNLARGLSKAALPWYAPGSSILIQIQGPSQPLRQQGLQALNNTCCLAPENNRPFGYGHILATPPLEPGGHHA